MKTKRFTPILYFYVAVIISSLVFSFSSASWSKDTYPQKAIRVIVPFTPGGSTDISVRGIAPYLQKELGVTIVVDNRPGAMGAIGYNRIFDAEPDGLTLGVLNIPAPQLLEYMQDTKFKTREYTHIAANFKLPAALYVNADGWNSFEEFMQAARQKNLKMGMTAKAGLTYLLGRIFEKSVGINVTWIPYAGGNQSLAALAGNHIDAVFAPPITARSLVNANTIKPLLMMSADPYPGHPEVLTIDKCGYEVDTYTGHFGFVGPPGISADKVKILENAIRKASQNPDFLKWVEKVDQRDVLEFLGSAEYRAETERQYKIVEKYKMYLKD